MITVFIEAHYAISFYGGYFHLKTCQWSLDKLKVKQEWVGVKQEG